MGSYIESDDPHHLRADRREKHRAEMNERGYDVRRIGAVHRTTVLYVHRVCGSFVAIPDAHDKCCPANDLSDRFPELIEDM